MLDVNTKILLYNACSNNEYVTVRNNLIKSEINTALDDNDNTALHIAVSHGYLEIIRLLFSHDASRTVVNKEGKTPEQMTSDDKVRQLFNDTIEGELIKWVDGFDSCHDACRIASENHEHMKRWITNIPLEKLLEELKNYVDKMKFSTEAGRSEVKAYLEYGIEDNNPLYLLSIYLSTGLFASKLNRDLARVGSNFRLISANTNNANDEPPKDVGQHIFAALLINHAVFQSLHNASTTFRGMTLRKEELALYEVGKILMTRSFISTSKNRDVAGMYLGFHDPVDYPSVICIYKVSNPQSSLSVDSHSQFVQEEEVLIVPFVVFKVAEVRSVNIKREGQECMLREIELVECNPNSQ